MFNSERRAWLATFVVLAVLDAAWLMLVAVKLFQREVGPILRTEPVLWAILAFYLVYTIGLFLLAVQPALAERSAGKAARNGALVGLTAYATFDLTNLAVIKGWTVNLAATDITWGVILSTLAALAGYLAGARGT